MLCQRCENMKHDVSSRENYEHYPTWNDVVKSARGGCQLCRLVERDFPLSVPSMNFDDEQQTSSLGPIHSNFLSRSELVTLNLFSKSPRETIWLYFSLFQPQDDIKASGLKKPYVSGRDIAESSGSEACFQWAEKHLTFCLERHESCAHTASSTVRLPTRVLDLQSFNDSKDLCLHESCGETGSYATLSHCWGSGTKPFMTEMATLHLRRQRIDFGDLPRSFQDAVIIARRLKIRYLWIDTLCIIQDSIDDWAAESAQMAHIYKSSLLTISFTDYGDPYQPVLCDRAERLTCRLGGQMSHAFVRSSYISTDDTTSKPTEAKIVDYISNILGPLSHLGGRAWAYQERLLSPRVLSYTASQLIWECRQVVRCESNVTYEKPLMNLPAVSSEKESVYEFWLELVESFSQCALTFPGDKFPALSGLANEIGARLADTYVAGLWKSDLNQALLWKPAEKAFRVVEYRAPSWSWASFDGQIIYDTLQKGPLGEWKFLRIEHHRDMVVLDHHVHPTTSDPLGMIDRASLSVRGYCTPVESAGLKNAEITELLPQPFPGKDCTAISSYTFDNGTIQDLSCQYVLLQVSRWWGRTRKFVITSVDDEDDSKLDIDEDVEAPDIIALILSQADNDGEYRRVGLAKIGDEHRGKILWEERELTLI